MSRPVDVVIIGQGIAGTTLAWQLKNAGLSFVVIDREEPVTCSKIAAGLITPITGKRFAKSWDWELFWPEAVEFYRRVESITGAIFFETCPMLRLFSSREQREEFEKKVSQLHDVISANTPDIDSAQLIDRAGGFEMTGGRLNVPTYLEQSRIEFREMGAFIAGEVDVDRDVRLTENEVFLPDFNLVTNELICCQGIPNDVPETFRSVGFSPAKGEILEIHAPEFDEHRIIHGGMWIVPEKENRARVGATFDWNDQTVQTTPEARQLIEEQLRTFLNLDYKVVDQKAAVRPTMKDFRPVIGFHPQKSRLGIFNGLGSKGSLMAPRLGRLLVDHYLSGCPIPEEVSLKRWFN